MRRAIYVLLMCSAVICMSGCDREDYSQDRIRNERGLLIKQDMKFLKRGRDFGHFEVSAISDKGDTLFCFYRLPANTQNRKLKALLWVYDSPHALDFSQLDQSPSASMTSVVGFNTFDLFERDNAGSLKNSKRSVMKGILKTRRGVDMLWQLLRKHQVNDSTQIYIAGEGMSAALLLPALAGLPHRIAGVGLCEMARGMEKIKAWDDFDFAAPRNWSREQRARIGVLDPAPAELTFTKAPESISGNRSNLEAVLRWVAGKDTLTAPAKPDTVFTRVMKVES